MLKSNFLLVSIFESGTSIRNFFFIIILLFSIINLLFWSSLTSDVGLSEDKNLKSKYNNSEDYFEHYVLDIYTKYNLKDKKAVLHNINKLLTHHLFFSVDSHKRMS